MVSFTLSAPANDLNRVADALTLSAVVPGTVTRLVDPLMISVADKNALPDEASAITAKAFNAMTAGDEVMEVEEGGDVYIEVMVDRGTDGYPDGEAIDVALSLSDSSLGTLGAEKATVPDGTGDTKAPRVKLTTAVMSGLQDGMLVVSLTASGADATKGPVGSVTGTPLSLTITNTTTAVITAKSEMDIDDAVADALALGDGADGRWSPAPGDPDDGNDAGETATLEADDLFDFPATANVILAANSDDPSVSASVSGGVITLTANAVSDEDGPATITVMAAAQSPSSATITPQTDPNRAEVMFEVMAVASVTSKPMAPEVVADGRRDVDGQNWRLRVSWEAPDNNDGEALTYMLRYRPEGSTTWSAEDVAGWCGHSAGLITGIEGLWQWLCVPSGDYEVQVAATNSVGPSGWSDSTIGETGQAQVPGAKGQVTKIELRTGMPGALSRSTAIAPTTIGAARRVHVQEGANDIVVAVAVRWTHAELAALYAEDATPDPQEIDIVITGGRGLVSDHDLPPWLSWRDDEGDADFPNARWWGDGHRGTRVGVPVPKKPTPFLDEKRPTLRR